MRARSPAESVVDCASSGTIGPASALSTQPSAQGRTTIAVAVWVGLIAIAYFWGRIQIDGPGPSIHLGAPPLYGRFDLDVSWRMLWPIALACSVVAGAMTITERVSWRVLVAVVLLGATGWALALSVTDGWDAVAGPLANPRDYFSALDVVDGRGSFLSSFTDDIASYPTHVRGHPPGAVLMLLGLRAVGLGSMTVTALLVIAAGASASAAVLIAARDLAGEAAARRMSPFLILVPIAVWIATSFDAMFLGVSAWGLCLFVLATGRRDRRGDMFALTGGALLGVGLFLSYGVAPLGAAVLVVAAARRRVRPLVLAAAGVIAVALAFGAGGFWWWDGFLATREQYLLGVSRDRPYAYFLVANLAAVAVAVGPAAAAGAAHLRDRRLWLLAGGALVAIAAANLTGLSKGEVERVWLPFTPWLLVVTAARETAVTRWLGAQAVWTLAVQLGVQTPW